jgi:hypothetical protein
MPSVPTPPQLTDHFPDGEPVPEHLVVVDDMVKASHHMALAADRILRANPRNTLGHKLKDMAVAAGKAAQQIVHDGVLPR